MPMCVLHSSNSHFSSIINFSYPAPILRWPTQESPSGLCSITKQCLRCSLWLPSPRRSCNLFLIHLDQNLNVNVAAIYFFFYSKWLFHVCLHYAGCNIHVIVIFRIHYNENHTWREHQWRFIVQYKWYYIPCIHL